MKLFSTTILLILLYSSCSDSTKSRTEIDDGQNNKQNFVFIVVDDLGWTDLGYMGSDFHETPNIDSLSESSIVFDNAYSSGSVCSPSRAAIITGKHPARVNITDWIPGYDPKDRKLLGPQDNHELPLDELTLAEVLKENGYATFFAGKWHLGCKGFFPNNQGFETNIGGNHTGQPKGGYYAPYENPQIPDGDYGEYLTDRLTNESIKYIEKEACKDEPFFLYLTYYSVHTPIQPSERNIEKFENKLKTLDSIIKFRYENEDSKTTLNQRNPAYASMIYALDENVGRLIKVLKEKGVYESTTIFFTSDNGGLSTLLKEYNDDAPTSVVPLRAGKGWLYEGGIRVPLLIKPANYNNKQLVINEPVVGHDFYTTVLSMANINKPNDRTLDGKDISILFDGKGELGREEIYWHYPHYHGSGWRPGAAIRQGKWKLIEFYETNKVELYDLDKDISELNDVSSLYPEKVDSLKKKIIALQKSMKANHVKKNPDIRE